MKAHRRVTVFVHTVGIHTWSVLAGLSALAARSEIQLTYLPGPTIAAGQGVLLRVDDIDVLVDLSDHPRLLEPSFPGVTFKRSFIPPYAGDVRPLGLVAGYRSGFERLSRLAGVSLLAIRRRTDLAACVRLIAGQRFPPRYDDFAAPPSAKREKVLFQVRAWEPSSGSDPADRERVNAFRAEVIRQLRRELKERFVGGFVPSVFARSNYAALLADESTGWSQYASLVQECGIGVSTVGLHRSNPWKLVEYLAAGNAIVSEPLQGMLPVSLDASGSAELFKSPQACVDAVVRLLEAGRWREHAKAARQYYEEEVRPDRLMQNRLSEL